MIYVKKLKELLEKLPDDAKCVAYEGERIGICVMHDGKCGWIETGYSQYNECNHDKHDTKKIIQP